ncbi:unnamed protein product, partial [marine sediment metagenome]
GLNSPLTDILEFKISSFKIVEKDKNYIEVQIEGEENYLMNPGQPMIPRIIKKLELPFGATNINIEATPIGIEEIEIEKQIVPSRSPLPLSPNQDFKIKSQKDSTVYGSNELYPHEWCSYHVGVGLNSKAEIVTHLTINTFPVRYNPVEEKLIVADEIDVSFTYDDPKLDIFPQIADYDLAIITPAVFSSELQRLVTHKENFGVQTILKTTEEIYTEYTGIDKPEQIKKYIQFAIEEYGIKYVLLFGGLKSVIYGIHKDDINHGASGWYFPVRYSNFQWDGAPTYNFTSGEPGYLSDLYYADIYKEGGLFEDWDSNGNGVLAEWSGDDLRDIIDLYPDVAYGRLAVRSAKEAKDVITKIINYEKQPADPSWFKRMISLSGDGFLDQEDWDIHWDTNGLPDGEYTIFAQ